MMITIHGLPTNIKYQDLKAVIKQECNITDFILDNLVPEGNGFKKVRVGLANDSEGNHVIKCLNGYRFSGNILQVTPVGKPGDFQRQQNAFTDHARMDPWNNQSQWSSNQQQQQSQYNYQQNNNDRPSNVLNQSTRSQYDQRISIHDRIGPPSQGFPIPQKNALPQAGTQVREGFLRTVEVIDTARNIPQRPERYVGSYDRPATIMKDNFQGRQFNVAPQQSLGHYQESSWGHQELLNKNQRMVYDNSPQDKRGPVKESKDMSFKEKHQFQGRPRDISAPESIDSNRRNIPSEIHVSHTRRFSPSDRRASPGVRRVSPGGRHLSPSGRRISPGGRRMSPGGRRISPGGRRISPNSRRISPNSRRISPNSRRISPNTRRISPGGRRISPGGRRMSPSGRRTSPNTRRLTPGEDSRRPTGRPSSPSYGESQYRDFQGSQAFRPPSPSNRLNLDSGTRLSPSRRMSPVGQQIAPFSRSMPTPSGRPVDPVGRPMSPMGRGHGRHISPMQKESIDGRNILPRRNDLRRTSPVKKSGQDRYSPSRNFDNSRTGKQVRPAYDTASDSNQATYSGDYRPNENIHYPSRGRDDRPNVWSNRPSEHSKSHTEERRDMSRMSKFEPARPNEHSRVMEDEAKRSSRNRDSRSPRRDRSPIRDRFKRHSPSPRSPRRSWALEKRRSPDDPKVPPPPSWPDHSGTRDIREKRKSYPVQEEASRGPTWDMNKYDPTPDERRDIRSTPDDRRPLERASITVRKDLEKWKPIGNDSPKLSPPRYKPEENERALRKREIESRHLDNRMVEVDRKIRPDRKEFEEPREDERRYKSDFADTSELSKIKEELTRRIEKKTEILKKQEELQKEIEDVYKRAAYFTKKAEYRKGDRRHDEYKDQRRRDNLDPKEFDLPTLTRLKEEHREIHYEREDTRPESRDNKPRHEDSRVDDPCEKRNKACETIVDRILEKFGGMLPSDITLRVKKDMKLVIWKILRKMFGDEDVSFIEMVIKFNSKHSTKDEEDIYDSVLSGFPYQYRSLKRPAKDEPCEVAAKISKPSPVSKVEKDFGATQIFGPQSWDYGFSTVQVGQTPTFMAPHYMIPFPTFVPTYSEVPKFQSGGMEFQSDSDGFALYLCKDDFQPINGYEADLLKHYIINEIVQVSHNSQGWSPDCTLKGLQNPYRYEVLTRDNASRDWLLGIDFSKITDFNVLVYSKEELWYERAAIWLPGHSRSRLEPLEKLKLQNKSLESINIGRWKLVKKVVNARGTRVYVDMPPSSARALESHNMMLSYELQKVNVFLKAVAVDKDAFDAGLKEPSFNSSVKPQSPMPSLANDIDAVKFCMKGDKPVSLAIACKIKESIIYNLFKYLQSGGTSRTDFSKYGFMTAGYFGVLPENAESRRWLTSVELGYISKQPITVFGADDYQTRFIKMTIVLPGEPFLNPASVIERLRVSNQGVKGIHFNKWKCHKLDYQKFVRQSIFEVEMDLDSIERIARLMFQLDYVVDGVENVVDVKSQYPESKLREIIDKYKEEDSDKYDVANMDLSSDSESDDVVCLD